MSRLPFHAEQKLLNYAKANNIDVAAIYTYLDACPNGWKRKKIVDVVKGVYNGFETCERSMRNSGLRSFFDKRLCISEDALELLKEKLIQLMKVNR